MSHAKKTTSQNATQSVTTGAVETKSMSLRDMVTVTVTGFKTNTAPQFNASKGTYSTIVANLRINIALKDSGIVLFPALNGVMRLYQDKNGEKSLWVDVNNSQKPIGSDTVYPRSEPSRDLNDLIYIEAIKEFKKSGFEQMNRASSLAKTTGIDQSEVVGLMKDCIAKASSNIQPTAVIRTERKSADASVQAGMEVDEGLPL